MRFTYNGNQYMITKDFNRGYRVEKDSQDGRELFIEDTKAFRAFREYDNQLDELAQAAADFDELAETYDGFLAGAGAW